MNVGESGAIRQVCALFLIEDDRRPVGSSGRGLAMMRPRDRRSVTVPTAPPCRFPMVCPGRGQLQKLPQVPSEEHGKQESREGQGHCLSPTMGEAR